MVCPPTTSWTRFSIPLNVAITPDTLRLLCLTGEAPGSSMSLDDIKFVGGDLGLNDLKDLSFALYPNPTSEWLNINSTTSLNKVEFFDISGKLVKTIKMNGSMKYVNIKSLNPGQYLLVKAHANGAFVTKSLIVQ